jgi:hypothetical protein
LRRAGQQPGSLAAQRLDVLLDICAAGYGVEGVDRDSLGKQSPRSCVGRP